MSEDRGYRFLLPERPRRVGRTLALGLAALFFALPSVGAGLRWLGNLGGGGASEFLAGTAAFLFSVPYLALGYGCALAAWRAVAGRCVVEITPESLRAIELIGFHERAEEWDSGSPLDAVVVSRPERGGASLALRVDFEHKPSLWLARGYPRSKLEELGKNLLEATREWSEPSGGLRPEPVEPEELETDIALLRTAEGLRFEVPAVGLGRGTGRGFWMMAWFPLGFVALFELVKSGAGSGSFGWGDVGPSVFLMLFYAAGLGLLAVGWQLAFRTATLSIDDELLTVARRSPFGDSRQHFEREAIEDLRVGPSGLEVNDRQILELQIHAGGKKSLGMLSQRSVGELEWIVATLREELTLTEGALSGAETEA